MLLKELKGLGNQKSTKDKKADKREVKAPKHFDDDETSLHDTASDTEDTEKALNHVFGITLTLNLVKLCMCKRICAHYIA